MSLLDRVQRRSGDAADGLDPADTGGAPAGSPEQQAAAAPQPAPALTGWQVRQASVARPDGAGAASAPAAPRPAAPALPSEPAAREAQARPTPSLMTRTAPVEPAPGARASSLLNRTGAGRGPMVRSGVNSQYSQLRLKVHQRLVEELAGNTDVTAGEQVRQRIADLVNEVAAEMNMTMTRQDRLRVVDTVTDDVLGLGPLEHLLNDPDVTEIMINGPRQIYVEQRGKLSVSPVTFESNDQLMQVIDRIVSTIGRRVDESSPMVDARLKDGSRVNVIIPPLALRGPTVTIRKFAKEAFTVDDLVTFNSLTADMIRYLRACVRARLNIVVSGGTGSGKTTTLNILSSFIPEEERIVTIEDAAELQLRQEHVVTLETRPANIEGRGRVSIRDLVINSLRMRPDRIVVGECRGGEALDMLQAMNTGHDGSLTTLHANNPRECIGRLETLVLMAGAELPSRAIREQIGSAINVIVQQSRLRDGSRKVVSITEVMGSADGEVRLNEVFAYRQTGIDDDGRVIGDFAPTGAEPHFLEHLVAQGEALPAELFTPMRVVGED